MNDKVYTRIVCSNDEYTGSIFVNDEPLTIDEVCDLLNEQQKAITTLVVKQFSMIDEFIEEPVSEVEQLKQKIAELELVIKGLNYALKYIKKIDVEVEVE